LYAIVRSLRTSASGDLETGKGYSRITQRLQS
jgi:hypothetical protein